MSFCQYCGTNLEEGAVCNCDGAVKASSAADSPAPVVAPTPEQPVAPSPVANTSSQAADTAKATMDEVKGTLAAFVKDPMAVTSSGKHVSMFAALSLLVIQAICFVLFIWFFSSTARTDAVDNIEKLGRLVGKDQTVSEYVSDQKSRIKDGFSDDATDLQKAIMLSGANDLSYKGLRFVFNALIVSLLSSGVIFGLLFLCCKLFKSDDDYTKILSTVSLASIPWSILWLIYTVINFVTEKSSSMLTSIIIALMLFIMTASICLLFSGLTTSIENSYKRLLSISLTYGVGIPLFIGITVKIFQNAPLFANLLIKILLAGTGLSNFI